MKKRRKKAMKVAIAGVAIVPVVPLIGLMVTGYAIGWGPFGEFVYQNNHYYDVGSETFEVTRTKFHIQGENGLIEGHLYLSENGEEKKQLVILCHGLNAEMWHGAKEAGSLSRAGVSCLIFDFCGGSNGARSEGRTTDMSVLTEVRDLNNVIETVKTWDFIDPSRISLMGFSQGGLVAAVTAAQRNDIDKLCLNYAAFSMYDEIKSDYKTVDDIPDTLMRGKINTGKRYYADIVTFPTDNIYEYCASFGGPVLLLHGTADQAVPYECSVTAKQYYARAKMVTIEGAGHGFVGEKDIIGMKEKARFFLS